jgi:hypothetical protein
MAEIPELDNFHGSTDTTLSRKKLPICIAPLAGEFASAPGQTTKQLVIGQNSLLNLSHRY